MTVTFYNITDDPRVLDKHLGTALLTLSNVKLKGEVDEFSPTLELANDVKLENANYFYIQEWGKYYYKVPNTTNNMGFIVQGEEDVRMTWKSQIRNSGGIISRCEATSLYRTDKGEDYPAMNCFISDDRIMVENRQLVTALQFPSGLPDTDEIILVVNGR